METSIDQVLQAVADRLTGGNKELGFGDFNRNFSTRVYIGEQNSESAPDGIALWYTWDPNKGRDGTAVPIPHRSFRGNLTGLRTFTKQSDDYGESIKLIIDMEADGDRYSFETGIESLTARSFLASVTAGEEADFAGPVTFTLEPGDKPKVIFARLISARDLLLTSTYKGVDALQLYVDARQTLGLPQETEASSSEEATQFATQGGNGLKAPQAPEPVTAGSPPPPKSKRPNRGFPGR